MIIKKKSILVIVLSSTVVAVVLVITLFGFYIYLNLKEENNNDAYISDIRQLNAKLYSKCILISSVVIKIGEEGAFKNEPVVEGQIKNTSNKKLVSLKLKLSLLDKDGRVLYMDAFYPLRHKSYFGVISEETGNFLAPSDSVSFKHILRNCPNDIEIYLKMKKQFAKEKKKETINIEYKIEELILE